MLDSLLSIFIGVTFFAFIGFLNRKNLSTSASEAFIGFADTKFYLSKWRFACNSFGHSWYNPKGIGTKLIQMYGAGACYSSADGDIHINLPKIQRHQEKDGDWRGFNPDSVDVAVEYILEHESLHSAIAEHIDEEYEKQEAQFKEKWNSSSRLEKIKIFYFSLRHGFGTRIPWDEEWIIKQVQDAKQSNREIQRIRRNILPGRSPNGGSVES